MAAEGAHMANEGACETASLPLLPSSLRNNKVKFLCSHGGKILPRPADGHLKYFGGETRIIAVPRYITFAELMKRLTSLFDGDMILKYQIIPEELDALVSVKSDEDLRHMLDEYDRQETLGSPRLRAFLFPSKPIILEYQPASMDAQALELRYIDAINGIIRRNSFAAKLTPIKAYRPCFSISSTCSSPKTLSPGSPVEPAMNQETIFFNGYQSSRLNMHKVKSSPSLYTLNNDQSQQQNNTHHLSNHHHSHVHPGHNHRQNYIHNHHYYAHGFQSSKPPPQDSHRSNGGERLPSAFSSHRVDIGKSQLGYGPVPDRYYTSTRHNRSCGGCNKCSHFDEFGTRGFPRLDRADSLPRSLPRSPRKAFWD